MNVVVKAWLSKSEGDYRVARREAGVVDQPNPDAVCFHAQQCVEKLMKTVLISRHAKAPKTHSLAELSRLITGVCPTWCWPEDELSLLARGGVEVRYSEEPATSEAAAAMLDICERVRGPLLLLVQESA